MKDGVYTKNETIVRPASDAEFLTKPKSGEIWPVSPGRRVTIQTGLTFTEDNYTITKITNPYAVCSVAALVVRVAHDVGSLAEWGLWLTNTWTGGIWYESNPVSIASVEGYDGLFVPRERWLVKNDGVSNHYEKVVPLVPYSEFYLELGFDDIDAINIADSKIFIFEE